MPQFNPENYQEHLKQNTYTWIVTGAAGFIGCNISRELLNLNQKVIGIDNFSTGKPQNIEDLKQNNQFSFFEKDTCNLEDIKPHFVGVDFVIHQAALGSVPRSIENPIASHNSNVNGFLNVMWLSIQNKIKTMVYASSSSVYGDDPTLPKTEDVYGSPLSPYAATKQVDEMYAKVFSKTYNFHITGLRYFNVFGPFQNTEGPYAAVIPKWITALTKGLPIEIYGDGLTSRDFCFIKNVIQANLLCALNHTTIPGGLVMNVAVGDTTPLNQLQDHIRRILKEMGFPTKSPAPIYKDFRPGDIAHSLANITRAQKHLSYKPHYTIYQGLEETVPWFHKKITSGK